MERLGCAKIASRSCLGVVCCHDAVRSPTVARVGDTRNMKSAALVVVHRICDGATKSSSVWPSLIFFSNRMLLMHVLLHQVSWGFSLLMVAFDTISPPTVFRFAGHRQPHPADDPPEVCRVHRADYSSSHSHHPGFYQDYGDGPGRVHRV